MGFHKLEENLIDMVKEQQAKLGFRPEVIRLYYPLSTLNHFFESSDSAEKMSERLKELGEHTKDTLGDVMVSAKGDRFCIRIPEEGSVFVHEQMKGREFIQDLVELVGHHGCDIEEIKGLFLRWSDQAVFAEIHDGDFDWAFHFADGVPDRYYYCFKDEGCHLIYHRFLPEDYAEL